MSDTTQTHIVIALVTTAILMMFFGPPAVWFFAGYAIIRIIEARKAS